MARPEPGSGRREADRGTVRKAVVGYAGASLGLVIGGTFLALRALPPLPAPDLVWGAGTAWGLQAVAFAVLYRALATGESALRPWIAGIGVRLGGLVLAFVLVSAGPASPTLGLAFGLALLGLLLLEATWLAVASPGA